MFALTVHVNATETKIRQSTPH